MYSYFTKSFRIVEINTNRTYTLSENLTPIASFKYHNAKGEFCTIHLKCYTSNT